MKRIVALLLSLAFLLPGIASASLSTNLISYWKLDESSGNASDSVGSESLTNTNTVSYDAGKINNGADFGSTNSNKWLNSSVEPGAGTGAITMSGWINVTTAPASGSLGTAFSHANNNGGSAIGDALDYWNVSGTLKLRYNRPQYGLQDNLLDYTVTLSTGTWYFVVITYDGSNQRLYVNGVLQAGPQAQSGVGTASNTSGVGLGQDRQDGANHWFSGHVDEVGLWTRALSQAEITQLYNAGVGCQYSFAACTSATPPFYWNWDF